MILRLSSSTKGHFTELKLSIAQTILSRFFNRLTLSELNPIERFWEFLKVKLQWENCQTLAQLRQKLADVLAITPEQIASLTSYDFILEALFSAAS